MTEDTAKIDLERPGNVLQLFYEDNRRGMDDKGISLPRGFGVGRDGSLTMLAFHLLAPGPGVDDPMRTTYMAIARYFLEQNPKEFVYGLDRYVEPGQGLTQARDCLSVHYWDGWLWRIGVIPYRPKDKYFGPVVWSLPHWTRMLQREMKAAMRMLHREFPRRSWPRALEDPPPFAPKNQAPEFSHHEERHD